MRDVVVHVITVVLLVLMEARDVALVIVLDGIQADVRFDSPWNTRLFDSSGSVTENETARLCDLVQIGTLS